MLSIATDIEMSESFEIAVKMDLASLREMQTAGMSESTPSVAEIVLSELERSCL